MSRAKTIREDLQGWGDGLEGGTAQPKQYGSQTMIGLGEAQESQVKVSLKQFHGIEINDFAVAVARTALWIAELQANIETESIVLTELPNLPLRKSA
ncbi:MAG: hypothetical protein QP867_04470 [Actinobaculum massiliense]|nr:DNA methyltransferase [Actinobaculum massiliense]MDK8318584.1 hypothetical protein [Actinobaculum massiliense]MDK8567115.1 hypothetical protein [Actinobaculum massiliense]